MENELASEFDVIVVGAGGSGLAAAIEAATHGARVVVLEKCAEIGGTTGRWSVGSISAAGSRIQRRDGVRDNTDDFYADMSLFAPALEGRDNLELRRILADRSGEAVDWLEDMGVEFFGPFPEPPHRQPRMHNVLPNSRSYARTLSRRAKALNVKIETNTQAMRLLVEDDIVVGVVARQDGAEKTFCAKRGVVLASGDFSADPELKRKHLGELAATVTAPNPNSTGDGQKMATEIGAVIVNGDIAAGPEVRFVAPRHRHLLAFLPPARSIARILKLGARIVPSGIFRRVLMQFLTTNLAPGKEFMSSSGAIVDGDGQLIAAEGPIAEAIAKTSDAYFILDSESVYRYSEWPNFISTAPGIAYAYLADYQNNRKDIYHSASSLAKLADKIGVDRKVLTNSIISHNKVVRSQESSAKDTRLVVQGPFVALGPAKAWIVITDGGLKVDGSMQVLDVAGAPIQGLYAAGSTGQGGVLLECHGTHVGWALVSGRLAGANAADNQEVVRRTAGGFMI